MMAWRLGWGGFALLVGASILVVAPDPARLAAGLPRLAGWLDGSWPPDFSGPGDIAWRAAETVGIATLGTTLAALFAAPLALGATRQIVPARALYHFGRGLLDSLRGIDAFVFALLFVAAVGLGPFAGMLVIALHSAGSVAKLLSEAMEAADPRPVEAIQAVGCTRLNVAAWALIPATLPQTASALLYVWEFNIRASTVLGLVGTWGSGKS
jgi:phosphonate transport system permease protein